MKIEYTENMKFKGLYASLLRSIVVNAIVAVKQEIKFFGDTSATFNSLLDGIKSEINAKRRMNVICLSDYCRIETDNITYANFINKMTREVICSIELRKEVKGE